MHLYSHNILLTTFCNDWLFTYSYFPKIKFYFTLYSKKLSILIRRNLFGHEVSVYLHFSGFCVQLEIPSVEIHLFLYLVLFLFNLSCANGKFVHQYSIVYIGNDIYVISCDFSNKGLLSYWIYRKWRHLHVWIQSDTVNLKLADNYYSLIRTYSIICESTYHNAK